MACARGRVDPAAALDTARATTCPQVVTTIDEFFWHIEMEYKLYAYRGNSPHNPDDTVAWTNRLCTAEVSRARMHACEHETHALARPGGV